MNNTMVKISLDGLNNVMKFRFVFIAKMTINYWILWLRMELLEFATARSADEATSEAGDILGLVVMMVQQNSFDYPFKQETWIEQTRRIATDGEEAYFARLMDAIKGDQRCWLDHPVGTKAINNIWKDDEIKPELWYICNALICYLANKLGQDRFDCAIDRVIAKHKRINAGWR